MKTENPQKILPTYGLVAFFDVLGYTQLIRREEIEDIVTLIQTSFVGAVKETNKKWKTVMRGPFGNYVPKLLIFSDSILVTSHLPRTELEQRAPVFLMVCQDLVAKLFANGLPVRGAISTGEFYLSEKPLVFAGLSIAEAHELANSLELAGCALTLNAEKALGQWLPKTLLKYHPVPIKGNKKQNLYLLDYFHC